MAKETFQALVARGFKFQCNSSTEIWPQSSVVQQMQNITVYGNVTPVWRKTSESHVDHGKLTWAVVDAWLQPITIVTGTVVAVVRVNALLWTSPVVELAFVHRAARSRCRQRTLQIKSCI